MLNARLVLTGASMLLFIGAVRASSGPANPTFVTQQGDALVAESTFEMPNVLGGRPVAVWRYGAFLSIDPSGSAPLIDIIDRTGTITRRIEFAIPGASWARLRYGNVTRDSGGAIVVAGSASTDSQHTAFIARLDPGAKDLQITQTSPFVPNALAVGPDGTVWAAGWETGANEHGDHAVIRRFEKSGRQLPALLPRSSLQIQDKGRFGHPAIRSYLISSPEGVGWYSEAAEIYMEFAADGREIGRYRAVGSSIKFAGIAMCEDGTVFVGHARKGQKPGVYSLDRSRNVWSLHTHPAAKSTILYGCEGENLVIRRGLTTFELLRRPSTADARSE